MDIISLSGRIKSLEKRFLNTDALEKLLEAKNFQEFAGLLENSFYAISGHINSYEELTSFFEDSRGLLTGEMSRVLPRPLYNYFVLRYDYHNLNLLAENREEANKYSEYSSVQFLVLREALKTNNYKDIPYYLKNSLSIIGKRGETNASDLSFLLKKSYCKVANQLLKTQNSVSIEYFFGIEIDFVNIASFIQKNISDGLLEQNCLVEGGNIRKERFLNEDILWKSVNTQYHKTAVPVNAGNYEMERYRTLMEYISRGRVVPFGIEPVFFYFAARDIELENVRRLAIGKFYNIEAKILSEWGIFPYQYV
ncbi:MAG TPA: V-type ATPase subunit [bacterium]|nr:V-type ATPase subunit [bacterium]